MQNGLFQFDLLLKNIWLVYIIIIDFYYYWRVIVYLLQALKSLSDQIWYYAIKLKREAFKVTGASI